MQHMQRRVSRRKSIYILAALLLLVLAVVIAAAHFATLRSQPEAEATKDICSIISSERASAVLGAQAVLSQKTNDSTSPPKSDVGSVSCFYTLKEADPSKDGALIITVRTPRTDTAKAELQGSFTASRLAGEIEGEIDGSKSFTLAHDNAVELRIWANERWLDIHADSYENARSVAGIVTRALNE